MAIKKDWLGDVSSVDADAKALAKSDAAQRKAAEKKPQSIILNTKDLSGKVDATKVLETTLGGVKGSKRPITNEDLAAFRKNVETFKQTKQLTFGITARQVINMANAVVSGEGSDLKRANREIKTSIPVSFSQNVVRFTTNAGPDSDVSRHYVEVEFLAFKDAANGSMLDAKKAALWLCRQPLKFNCDCGRHRYWFRYIATIGGFNVGKPFGRDEFGYPKIRNPGLIGVACKHVLRVMGDIESSMIVTNFLARLIDKAIASGKARAKLVASQEEANANLKAHKGSAIRSSGEREAAKKALDKIPPPKKPQKPPSKIQIQEFVNSLSGLPPEQVAAIMAQIQSVQTGKK